MKLLNLLLLLLQMEEILPHPQGHDVHILLRYRQFGIPECIIPEQEHLQDSGFQSLKNKAFKTSQLIHLINLCRTLNHDETNLRRNSSS